MKYLKMITKLFILLIITCSFSFAQQNKSLISDSYNTSTFKYYVDIKTVATKQICLDIENKIGSKTGIVSFKTVGFPSKYFVLQSNLEVSESELRNWLSENNLELTFFGSSENALETLIFNKRKNNQSK